MPALQGTLYEIVGVPETANADTIRRAYRRLALSEHPDRIQYPPLVATSRFQVIRLAFDTLASPRLRMRYDWQLQQERWRAVVDAAAAACMRARGAQRAQEAARGAQRSWRQEPSSWNDPDLQFGDAPSPPRRRHKRQGWTNAEDNALHAGISRFGSGRWCQIQASYRELERISNVNLKDRARTVKLNGRARSAV